MSLRYDLAPRGASQQASEGERRLQSSDLLQRLIRALDRHTGSAASQEQWRKYWMPERGPGRSQSAGERDVT